MSLNLFIILQLPMRTNVFGMHFCWFANELLQLCSASIDWYGQMLSVSAIQSRQLAQSTVHIRPLLWFSSFPQRISGWIYWLIKLLRVRFYIVYFFFEQILWKVISTRLVSEWLFILTVVRLLLDQVVCRVHQEINCTQELHRLR